MHNVTHSTIKLVFKKDNLYSPLFQTKTRKHLYD